LAKLKATYMDALPTMIYPATGRVHTSFNQVVAVTGRLSSADPNLQNIPIRTPEGRQIRAAFVPQPGWQLVMADYSQVELRVLAHFSRDPSLLDAFQQDEDIHARVAAEVFHLPLPEVTSEQRRRAKAVNFGVIYGQSAFGLAKALGITQEEAAAFIDAYFARYQGILTFMEQVLDECQRQRFVTTMLGRRRRIVGVRPAEQRSARQRNLPERTAINSVIQGTAADLIKMAMIAIHRRIGREGGQARMLLQIHDELMFEVPRAEQAALVTLVRTEMEHVAPLQVPLRVDIQVGGSWADAE
jgi:DNA polymerase-1